MLFSYRLLQRLFWNLVRTAFQEFFFENNLWSSVFSCFVSLDISELWFWPGDVQKKLICIVLCLDDVAHVALYIQCSFTSLFQNCHFYWFSFLVITWSIPVRATLSLPPQSDCNDFVGIIFWLLSGLLSSCEWIFNCLLDGWPKLYCLSAVWRRCAKRGSWLYVASRRPKIQRRSEDGELNLAKITARCSRLTSKNSAYHWAQTQFC